jgi:hypothetical protein
VFSIYMFISIILPSSLIHPNNTFVYLVQCNSPIDCLHQARP